MHNISPYKAIIELVAAKYFKPRICLQIYYYVQKSLKTINLYKKQAIN